ncbi:hypothetical protein MUB23_09525 [Cuneatibacter sp. NSJ-177]|jgi:uncharacterized Zn finger protein|uniref:hypothetical protein n=1 Tax=Cuneatibacter sp. NSJ-177 TaxID=2931401 RepID=UPI001FD2FB0E|nr:hypothetical protein [Cuneatibacter sp. NSJ-177]MCJ7835630.1 hypothetical protein [Cuneatibacter sp. NSJ-177]
MAILESCEESRKNITIKEVECPQCKAVIEVFLREGATTEDAKCEKCGYVIPAGTHFE